MRLADMKPSADDIRRYTEAGHWTATTTNEILERNAAQFREREALVDVRRRLSWRDYHRRVQRLAAHWLKLGLTRDDVIAVQLPNWNEFAVVVNAAMMLGIPFCQFHSDFRSIMHDSV